MRILVTNDDGIHAPGLIALEKIAAALSDDVWVVAPAEEQSGAPRRPPWYGRVARGFGFSWQ